MVTISVTTVIGCGVMASSGSPWLNVTTTQPAPGQFQVSIGVAADSGGTPRSGIKIIGDQIYRVFQAESPTSCSYSLTTNSASLGAAASSGSVGVLASAGCTWIVTNPQPSWLTINSGSLGMANGTVNYSVAANPSSSPRSALLNIAGLTFTITQAASTSTTGVGIFRSSNGLWLLDSNFDHMFDQGDTVGLFAGSGLAPQPGDIAVSGDWSGTGTTKIGLYRPSTGTWFLDYNGNGV